MISQVQDITSKKEAEHNFKETSERLNVATRVANIGIWEYHIANNTVQCNDNMYDIYGIPKGTADLLDEWLKHILPEDVEKVTTALQRTINNHAPLNIKFRGIKPNGEIIHLVVIGEAQSGNDGKIEKIIGSNLDITALRSTTIKNLGYNPPR